MITIIFAVLFFPWETVKSISSVQTFGLHPNPLQIMLIRIQNTEKPQYLDSLLELGLPFFYL